MPDVAELNDRSFTLPTSKCCVAVRLAYANRAFRTKEITNSYLSQLGFAELTQGQSAFGGLPPKNHCFIFGAEDTIPSR